MNESNNQLLVKSINVLTDNTGRLSTFVKAEPVFSNELVIPQPDYIKLLINKELDTTVINQTINSIIDNDYLYMLPKGHDVWRFLGSDGNSGSVFYGDTTLILKADKLLEDLIVDSIANYSIGDFLNEEYTYMVWHLENNKSILIVYHDYGYGIHLSKEIESLELLRIDMGGICDDILANESIFSGIVKEIKSIHTGNELDEDLIEDSLDNEYDKDFISYGNKKITKKELPLLMELAKVIYCDFMKFHSLEVLDDDYQDDIEIAKRILRYHEIQKTELPTIECEQRIIFQENGSNKEYTVRFKKSDDNWIVEAVYGAIGKKLKTIEKYNNTDYIKAQHVYRNLLIEKLKEGYQ